MNGLDRIKTTLKNYSAIDFAEKKLQQQKGGDYYTHMRTCYSGKDNPTIEECEQNAFLQFMNEYKKCCEIYSGWISNGRVFILDRRDRLVLFLYKKDETTHSAIVHFNPLKVDLIEYSCPNAIFFRGLQDGRYDLSVDEDSIIRECSDLVNSYIANFSSQG